MANNYIKHGNSEMNGALGNVEGGTKSISEYQARLTGVPKI